MVKTVFIAFLVISTLAMVEMKTYLVETAGNTGDVSTPKKDDKPKEGVDYKGSPEYYTAEDTEYYYQDGYGNPDEWMG